MKVVFYFPWKELSGGPFYLSELAIELSKIENNQVYYVDYLDGIALCNLKGTNVHVVIYGKHEAFLQSNECILVTPIYCAPHIPQMNSRSKIIFLNWHNYCIKSLINTWRMDERELQDFLEMVYKTDSVFFLDAAHRDAQNKFIAYDKGYVFPEKYVPITIRIGKNDAAKKEGLCDGRWLSIAILGRLTIDKTYSIINVLKCIKNTVVDIPLKIYIIGSGEGGERIKSFCNNKNVTIEMKGVISGEELQYFLREKVDILFGMGSSVLQGAGLGLPSVIIPHNFKDFICDKYTYLHESTGYALGWYDTQIEDLNVRWHRIEDIILDLYVNNQKFVMGQKDYDYVLTKHTSNIDKFVDALNKTTLTYRDFEKIAKRQGKIRICGIAVATIRSTFDEKERYVSLFGIGGGIEYYATDFGGEFYFFKKRVDWLKIVKCGDKKRLKLWIKKKGRG